MTVQEIIELIFVWGLAGMGATLVLGLVVFFARFALFGGVVAGLFWILDRLPFLN